MAGSKIVYAILVLQVVALGTFVSPITLKCPSELSGKLAECGRRHECNTHNDCPDLRSCCNDVCGTRRCWEPWMNVPAPILSSPLCHGVTCLGQGEICTVVDNVAKCRCNTNCEDVDTQEDIVCGSDGMTYMTACLMDLTGCRAKKEITRADCNTVPTPNTIRHTSSMASNEIEIRAPKLRRLPSPIEVMERSISIHIACDATGYPNPAIFWKVRTSPEYLRPGESFGRFSVTTGSELIIDNIQTSDAGIYTCVAANSAGAITVNFTVTMNTERSAAREIDCYSTPYEQGRRCPLSNRENVIQRWVFSNEQNRCIKEFFRDCDAVTNKFRTRNECISKCSSRCSMPAVKGKCRRFVQRVYYNNETRECEPFYYGGCGGNANNFKNVEECRSHCSTSTENVKTYDEVCGVCRQQIGRAYCHTDFIILAELNRFQERNFSDARVVSVTVNHVIRISPKIPPWMLRRNQEVDILFKQNRTCPCPDMRAMTQQVRARLDEGAPTRKSSFTNEVVMLGKLEGSLGLVIDQYGFADEKTTEIVKQINSMRRFPRFCEYFSRISAGR